MFCHAIALIKMYTCNSLTGYKKYAFVNFDIIAKKNNHKHHQENIRAYKKFRNFIFFVSTKT